MSEKLTISELMEESGVLFGTSGARGLVSQMTDRVCYAYVQGFLQHVESAKGLERRTDGPARAVGIGGDRRPSTPRIMRAVAAGAQALGYRPIHLGLIPSPAVALYGMQKGIPTVMVTGSHIPADRNGMKFTTAAGEIKKSDEAGIKQSVVELPDIFQEDGALAAPVDLPRAELTALEGYLQRYLSAFPARCLSGLRLGVYGHSAVGRDFLVRLYGALGAEVLPLGFSEDFVPVDTEAIRPEDEALALGWAKEHHLDAILSTDGDSDRPLTADERGTFLRGDVSGILTARFFSADGVSTPVSCNTALELSGEFERVVRTRIGSPFVITGMEELRAEGASRVVGYEANGGFLHETPLLVPGGQILERLPTRDPVIVHLAVLLLAKSLGRPISHLLTTLPERITASDRDQSFRTARSQALLQRLTGSSPQELEAAFGLGPVVSRNETDGLRLTFQSGEILHLRPSGNAPELRCYAEALSPARARELVELGLERARALS